MVEREVCRLGEIIELIVPGIDIHNRFGEDIR